MKDRILSQDSPKGKPKAPPIEMRAFLSGDEKSRHVPANAPPSRAE
jgi:hypothetical protein